MAAKILSFADITGKNNAKFVPHAKVPIPELAIDGEAPVIYLVAPCVSSVLTMTADIKGDGDGKVTGEAATTAMTDLILECARNEDGTPLCASLEDVKNLPIFVFSRLSDKINELSTGGGKGGAGTEEAAGKG